MTKPEKSISTRGANCPMPLILLSEAVAEMRSGMVLEVTGDDPVFEIGVRDFCEARGYEVMEVDVAESFVTMRFRI